ncbi:cell division protein FtsQ/DivIB [Neptunomonas sp.]|uniref:cell division protein FtsQ/DivIB n=1 Tax=Neptunomonas sp. TaxID=1971898 RepID=UPI0035681192
MAAGLQKLRVFDQAALPPMAKSASEKGSDKRSEKGSQDESEKQNGKDSEGYWRPLLILTAFLIFCSLMLSGYSQAVMWLDKPIAEVRIIGDTKYLNKRVLAEKLAAGINAPLMNVDIAGLRETILDDPWVHGAKIKRDWPPAVEVTIDEQIPVARWGGKGLLNHQGDIFWPESTEGYLSLPVLNGPATQTQQLMAQYHDLSRLFQGADVKMTGLSMEARGAWSLVLDNGIEVIVGREQLRERLQRFLHVYQKELAPRAEQIEKVDIRYTNGVAVKWRKHEEQVEAG